MKILLAHRYDPNYPMGGAARFVLEMAAPLRDELNVEVACVTNRGELAEKLAEKKIPVYDIPYPQIMTPVIVNRLAECLRDFRPDLVHSHHRYLTFLLDIFFKRKTVILHTEHVLRKNRKWLFRYGHCATAVSQAVCDNLKDYYGVPEENLTAIPNAVRIREPDPKKMEDYERMFRKSENKIIALCVGRLDEQKGHVYLIRAAGLLPVEIRKNLLILLAGEGPLRDVLVKEAEANNVAGNFVFLGHTQDVSELLHLCDFLVLPSLWEGMPLSVLEAYQAGKPVIATDIPGTREVVVNGKTGILAEPKDPRALADALSEALKNPSHLKGMADAVTRRAREFSFETMLSRYHQLYKKRIDENGRP